MKFFVAIAVLAAVAQAQECQEQKDALNTCLDTSMATDVAACAAAANDYAACITPTAGMGETLPSINTKDGKMHVAAEEMIIKQSPESEGVPVIGAMQGLSAEIAHNKEMSDASQDMLRQTLTDRMDEAVRTSSKTLMNNFTSEIGTLSASLNSNMEQVDSDISALNNTLNVELKKALADLSETFTQSQQQLSDSVDKSIDSLEGKDEEIEGKLNTLISPPLGKAKTTPGLSCAHILAANPLAADGKYWIDPNGAANTDAFQATCDMANGGVTVIKIKEGTFPNKNRYTGSDSRRLWTQIGGKKFEYEISSTQLAALQKLSVSASQEINFECSGVLISKYNRDNNHLFTYDNALIIHGANDEKIYGQAYGVDHNPNLLYSTGLDTCMGNGKGKTDIFVTTKEVRAMPISDFSLHDIGSSSESFGFTLSDVRFSTVVQKTIGTTYDNPAKNCREILAQVPNAQDGLYYIHPLPTKGTPTLVKCDMTCTNDEGPCSGTTHVPGNPRYPGGWTCIQSRRQVNFKNWYSGSDGFRYFSTMSGGWRLTYQLDETQTAALRAISGHAKQIIKMSCADVILWSSGGGNSYSNAAKFRGPGSTLWQINNGDFRYRPLVYAAEDECQTNSRHSSNIYKDHTIFRFETGNTAYLPIYDIAARDIGGSNEWFGADLGDACFL